MLNTLGSLCAARSLGVLDCVAYTAGVSGMVDAQFGLHCITLTADGC